MIISAKREKMVPLFIIKGDTGSLPINKHPVTTSSKKTLAFIALFSLAMFVLSNTTTIRQSMCRSSPCSSVNETTAVQDVQRGLPGFIDTFLLSYSNALLAPSTLLIPTVFESKDSLVTNTYGSRIYIDTDDSVLIAKSNIEAVVDKTNFVKHWILIKLIVLISFPCWLALGFILHKIYQWKRSVAILLLTIILVFGGLWKFAVGSMMTDGANITVQQMIGGK